MRLSVRQQLCLILILSGCIGLAVLAIATWVTNHNFVLSVASKQLYTSAALKAAQVAFNLELMQIAATFVTTREILQTSLARYNNGSLTNSTDWTSAQSDLENTLGDVGPLSRALVLQVEVFAANQSGPAGAESVLNVTGRGVSEILLPWNNANGTQAYFGEPGIGYPASLYPNLTASESNGTYYAEYEGVRLGPESTLVLGPLVINGSFSLISMTLPIVNTTRNGDVLGWVTATCDGRLIQTVVQDRTGLGDSGQTLLVGPTNTSNTFPPGILGSYAATSAEVEYLFPLNNTAENQNLHDMHVVGSDNPPFPASAYPAIATAFANNVSSADDFGTLLETHDEENKSVSAGYSLAPTDLVDWVIIVEMPRSEVWQPINRLRAIILACLFSVMGFLFVISFPVAHWFVRPIIRLRAATAQTIEPPSRPSRGASCKSASNCTATASSESTLVHKGGIKSHLSNWRKRKSWHTSSTELDSMMDQEEKSFRIPGKVAERKPWITDEMTDLIATFNEMSDELLMQYTRLEDRVKQRTIELEHSKKAAETANESKTLFVANVSHELKTPLNGILGMCAVSMEEEDPSKLKRSMGIIYKSGDLLLRTLNDLLTFSTNQVGHKTLTLDEKEFALRDVETQVYSIFSEQAKDNQIDLHVEFEDTGLRDFKMWGDMHRILQVIINLTSNGLKFTPPGGSVTVIMRRLNESPLPRSSMRIDKPSNRKSTSYDSTSNGTANFINPRETVDMAERTAAPVGQDVFLEFEVRDTGPGIAEEAQRRIFEPFVQADAGLSRKHSGTGLGLSICSQLASLMKGSIDLKSQVGEGSSFTLKLPLRQLATRHESVSDTPSKSTSRNSVGIDGPASPTKASSAPPMVVVEDTSTQVVGGSSAGTSLKQAVTSATKEVKAAKEAKHDFSRVRVLVAEDNKVNQEVITRMLKLEKIHDVTIAEDGQIALDLVKTNAAPYDLIFMDVQMPRMDGLLSTKLIREHGFKRPIVALTAFAEQSNIDECYGSGMDYFLAKPIRRPQLKKVLTEYCTPSPTRDAEKAGNSSVLVERENQVPVVQTREVEKTPEGTSVNSNSS